jgi:spermidine synthase
MMGHLPALVHTQDPAARSVLVVGFGAGVTAGSFVPYPDISRINICELEPLIPRASGEYFSKENNNVRSNPRTHLAYDDARHYILTSPDKFDIITTDPIHPWVKGSSTLFSKEYFQLVRDHLNPGGVAAQWLPLYESDEATIRTELATFFSVFPDATVWSNFLDGDGYDLVLLGSVDPPHIFVDDLQRLLEDRSFGAVSGSLAEIGIHSVAELAATYAGRARDLGQYISGAQVNTDLNMRLQYVAGLGVNSIAAPRIYTGILSYRTFPEDLFSGHGETVDDLREQMGRPRRIF